MESMNTILKILIGVLVCVGVVGALWWGATHLRNQPSGQTDTTTQPSGGGSLYPVTVGVSPTAATSSSGSQGTPSETIELKGNGIMVRTLDFIKDPSVKSSGGVYALSGGLHPSPNTTPYSTVYSAHDQSFVVSLLQEPLGSNRLAAEAALQQQLGINQAAMCQLNYYVGVPAAVNETYSGKNLGFSFCPGAVKLPL